MLRKIKDPRDRALFWLIYDGGLRSHVQSLSLQDLKESSPWFRIVARDQPKTGGGSFSCRAFAHNHFKRSILTALWRSSMNIASIEADGQRRSRFGQLVPLGRASLDKRGLLVAQFLFKALSHLVDVTRNRRGAQLMLHWQEISQETNGQAIRQE